MLSAVKRVCGVLVGIWLCVVRAVCRARGKSPEEAPPPACPEENQWSEEGWSGEGWDDFTVKVVPNSPDSEPEDPTPLEQDFFKDMEPVFRKTKKITVQQSGRYQPTPVEQQVNVHKFAVQENAFQQDCFTGELGVWSEEDGQAWEEELIPDEGQLVQETQESLREKRRQEREKRKAAQEALRKQQRAAGHYHTQLGTRVT